MGDLSSPSGIEPVSSTLEAWNLTHWTTREVPHSGFQIVLMQPGSE